MATLEELFAEAGDAARAEYPLGSTDLREGYVNGYMARAERDALTIRKLELRIEALESEIRDLKSEIDYLTDLDS